MPKTIFKYQLKQLNRKNTVLMPEGAEILSIQIQGQYLCVWVLVNTDVPKVERIIEVWETGKDLDYTPYTRKFLATVQFPQGLVFHFFEIIK
jgi:hypothetical protein